MRCRDNRRNITELTLAKRVLLPYTHMTRKKNETKIINHPSSKRAEGLYDDLGNKRKAMIQEKEKELKKAMSQAPRNEKLIQELATNLQALNA